MKKIDGIIQTIVSKTSDTFETEDGRIFYNEEDAIKYETNLKMKNSFIKKYKVKDIDKCYYGINADLDSTVISIYIEKIDNETLNDLRAYYPYLKTYNNWIEDIKIGINIIIVELSDSCSIGQWSGYCLYIHPLDDLIISKKEELNNMKELKNNYFLQL